ncbi:DNA repair ATPase, partial [mine drainage metagenome]
TGEIESYRSGQKTLLEEKTRLKNLFSSLGGDFLAVEAAADRQKVLSEMREVAEEVVRLKGAAILLRWAIDRYRKENQGPLLSRAGLLFSRLTLGSFESLGVDYDDQDRIVILGVRKEGPPVGISQMSTGTSDQLFLALRLAAVYEFLEHSGGMPFVVDDLLINFDDQRAMAALELLWELSTKTQVIFLTHHQHLVDLGREKLGNTIFVSSISSVG